MSDFILSGPDDVLIIGHVDSLLGEIYALAVQHKVFPETAKRINAFGQSLVGAYSLGVCNSCKLWHKIGGSSAESTDYILDFVKEEHSIHRFLIVLRDELAQKK